MSAGTVRRFELRAESTKCSCDCHSKAFNKTMLLCVNAGLEQWLIQECGAQSHVESTPREVLSGLLRLPLQRNIDPEQCTASHLQKVQLWRIQAASSTRRQANRSQGWAYKVSRLKQMKRKKTTADAKFVRSTFLLPSFLQRGLDS